MHLRRKKAAKLGKRERERRSRTFEEGRTFVRKKEKKIERKRKHPFKPFHI